MERLTVGWGNGTYDTFDQINIEYDAYSKDNYEKLLKKLGEYEDLEEQGLLLRLKLKVGDTFWELNSACSEPYIYPRRAHSLQHVLYCMDRLGKVTFLTEEEAEEALEKMKGGAE